MDSEEIRQASQMQSRLVELAETAVRENEDFITNTRLCDSFWHQTGHSSHSFCPTCSGCPTPKLIRARSCRATDRTVEMAKLILLCQANSDRRPAT